MAEEQETNFSSLIGKSAYVCADSPIFSVARSKDGKLIQGGSYKLFLPQREMKIYETAIGAETATAYGVLLLLKLPDTQLSFVLWTTLRKSDAHLAGEELRKAVLGQFAAPRFKGIDLELAQSGEVRPGMDSTTVRCLKGDPDRTITTLRGEAWFYDKQGTTIYFFDGRVHDVLKADRFSQPDVAD